MVAQALAVVKSSPEISLNIMNRWWSGEFSIFAVEHPELLIFSDLRFAILLCEEVPSRAKSIPPASVWTYSLGRRPYSPSRSLTIAFSRPYRKTYTQTVKAARNQIIESVRRLPDGDRRCVWPMCLSLSEG